MDAKTTIKDSIAMAEMIGMAYLGDLSDAELMKRPHPECNHINYQLGHLITSEHGMMSGMGVAMPALPNGFAEKYAKECAKSDDASKFATKDELMQVYKAQRAATLAALDKADIVDFDKSTGVDYAPTVGSMYAMQGAHWMMHCGQWVVVRRMCGKPIVM